MKTILISQKDLHATRSGVPRKVLEEIKYFAGRGHAAYAIAERIDNEKIIEAGGIPVKTFRWPLSGFFRRKFYMKRFESFAKKVKPDFVIGHGDIIDQDIAYIHNCVHLAYELINGKKIPKDHEVAKIHESILTGQKFKALVCNSQMMKDDLTKRFNIPSEKAYVIYPEYNPNVFNTKDAQSLRGEVRAKLELGDEVVIGLITSGNFKKRNVSVLVDAISRLPKEFLENIKIIVAGKDKPEKYIEQAKELGIDNLFTFLPSINAVQEYYHAIDIFVLPALIEEFGRSVLEAMGCGKSVIVSKMVGASEILKGEQREYILSDITSSELAEHLKKLLSSKELRERLGEQNSQVAKNYSDTCQSNKFHELLGKLGYLF